MKRLIIAATLSLFVSGVAKAADEYEKVPAGDAQYKACLAYSKKNYEGGDEKSKIAGQTKAQAWCTCMWNETPDDFRGDLAKFSETSKGAAMNKACEKYAGWD
ncbi:MAG: hypothetical protein HQL40_10775 [Alphaproteobacteria bacterium]|nr:hypothetical protein [Alphaproteobacteria bacterium]